MANPTMSAEERASDALGWFFHTPRDSEEEQMFQDIAEQIRQAEQIARLKILEERSLVHLVTATHLEDLAKKTGHNAATFCLEANWHRKQAAILRALTNESGEPGEAA